MSREHRVQLKCLHNTSNNFHSSHEEALAYTTRQGYRRKLRLQEDDRLIRSRAERLEKLQGSRRRPRQRIAFGCVLSHQRGVVYQVVDVFRRGCFQGYDDDDD